MHMTTLICLRLVSDSRVDGQLEMQDLSSQGVLGRMCGCGSHQHIDAKLWAQMRTSKGSEWRWGEKRTKG